MAKVITLSLQYPSYHTRKGEKTFFVEKAISSLTSAYGVRFFEDENYFNEGVYHTCVPKHHTIRAGKRWKDGQKASIRIWSGVPYHSKQITLAPDLTLKVKDIEITAWDNVIIDGELVSMYNTVYLAKNDGLGVADLINFFPKLPFSGQILVWSNAELPY